MLDNDIVVEKKENTFTPIPENMYNVELLDITSKQRPTYDTKTLPDDQKEYETVFDFQFVLLDGEENGKSLRGRSIWYNFVPSYLYVGKNGKNALYDIVEALQRQTVSPQQEAEGITGAYLNSLIGKRTRVATENKTKGDKTYSTIVKFYNPDASVAALTEQEKADAMPKAKDDAAEAVVDAAFDGVDITPEDIPFETK